MISRKTSINSHIRHNSKSMNIFEPIGFASIVHEWIIAAGFAIMTALVVFNVILGMVTVNGRSMEPTLHNGDRIITYRLFSRLESGDIVVLRLDESSFLGARTIVKRVVATAGQTVFIENGVVFVDGVPEGAEYELCDDPGIAYEPIVVPEGHIFVMGDNRNNSTDSRLLGMIPVSSVVGKQILHIKLGG